MQVFQYSGLKVIGIHENEKSSVVSKCTCMCMGSPYKFNIQNTTCVACLVFTFEPQFVLLFRFFIFIFFTVLGKEGMVELLAC